jgi:hypothetical protein
MLGRDLPTTATQVLGLSSQLPSSQRGGGIGGKKSWPRGARRPGNTRGGAKPLNYIRLPRSLVFRCLTYWCFLGLFFSLPARFQTEGKLNMGRRLRAANLRGGGGGGYRTGRHYATHGQEDSFY